MATATKNAPKKTAPKIEETNVNVPEVDITSKPEANPAAPVPPVSATATDETTTPEGKKARKPRAKWQKVHPTAEAAKECAKGLEGVNGHAWECKIKVGETEETYFVVGPSGSAGAVAFAEMGGTVTNLNGSAKPGRKAKPVGKDGILEALNALPAAERDAILAQLMSFKNAQ